MEFVKSIIALIISFFQRDIAKANEKIKIADANSVAIVETIRATENAVAVQHQVVVQQSLDKLQLAQQLKHEEAETKSLNDQLDEQFGSN